MDDGVTADAARGRVEDERAYGLAVWFVIAGLASFFVCMLIAIPFSPEGLYANRGFSYYGDQPETVGLYWLAFLFIGGSMLAATRWLPRTSPHATVRRFLWGMAVLLLGVLVSTQADGGPVQVLVHQGFGTALFILELVLAWWLTFIAWRDRANIVLFVLLMAAAVVSLLALLNVIPVLIYAQTVFQFLFGLLLVRTLVRIRPGAAGGQ